MSTATTKIEWTSRTWNPTRGCSRVSPGCESCYAERQAARFSGPGKPYDGLVRLGPNGPRWTGSVRLVPRALWEPLRWRAPGRVFVDSMSDLFHEALDDEEIAAVHGVMATAGWHTFQVLTKRADRLLSWSLAQRSGDPGEIVRAMKRAAVRRGVAMDVATLDQPAWPLPNVWIGVSVEDNRRAHERVPLLVRTPAAVRFLSVEPLLGRVDLERWLRPRCERCGHVYPTGAATAVCDDPSACGAGAHGVCGGAVKPPIDWVIVGGESGPEARPMHPEWCRAVVEQCAAARVPVFFKQWGVWKPIAGVHETDEDRTDGRTGADIAFEADNDGLEGVALQTNGACPQGFNPDHHDHQPDPSAVWMVRGGWEHAKGGDPSEWPEWSRVRQFPPTPTAPTSEEAPHA